MRVGILGGTFNPIHLVHLMVAEYVYDALKLDEIWFLPSHIPPHKEGKDILSASTRLEMVKLAIKEIPYFHVSSFELERSGPSYTVDTIRELKKSNPTHQFYFIIGGDMIDYLPHWHEIDELMEMIQFVGVLRPGYSPRNDYAKAVQLITMPLMDMSSTMIRERIKMGETIRFMVPEPVRRFIEENQLYES